MEALTRLVGGKGTIVTRGMPVGIDHGAAQQVVLGCQHVALAIHLHECGTVVATDVEHHSVGVGAIGHMAIDALSK